MSYYNVIRECVVGKLHYARPTTQPIEVDDEVAAPLVEAGDLEPYRPVDAPAEVVEIQDNFIGEIAAGAKRAEEDLAAAEVKLEKARRTRRRTGDSDGQAD